MNERPRILQDFCSPCESLGWRVGQRSWQALGSRLFTSDEVPSNVTNDGARAFAAAELLFASCAEAERAGCLEPELRVLELAAGLGLHARLLLDRFRELCAEGGKDWHERLTFFVTDGAARMVADMRRRGVLDAHRERVRLGVVDALAPRRFLPLEGGPPVELEGLRAIVHNYLLGVLPFEILLVGRREVRRAEVRTLTPYPAELERLAGGDLEALLESREEDAGERLSRVARLDRLLRAEWRSVPFRHEEHPHGARFEEFARRRLWPFMGGDSERETLLRVGHPFGALECLRASRAVLRPDGFLLFGDYGATRFEDLLLDHGFDRFGRSTANALCFLWIDHVLAASTSEWAEAVTPPGDERARVNTRLLLLQPSRPLRARFRQLFARRRIEEVRALDRAARNAARRGDAQRARELYLEACEQNDRAWNVMLHWAQLENRERHHELALDVASEACAINPHSSPRVWVEQGRAHAGLGDLEAALRSFRRAGRVDPRSPVALRRIAWAAAALDRHAEALEALGRLLALADSARVVEWALELQARVLAARGRQCAEARALAGHAAGRRAALADIGWRLEPADLELPWRARAFRAVEAAERFLASRQSRRGWWLEHGPFEPAAVDATGLVGWALAETPRTELGRGPCLRALRSLVGACGRDGWGASARDADAWTSGWTVQFLARMGMLDEGFGRRVASRFLESPSLEPACRALLGLGLCASHASHSRLARARRECLEARTASGAWPDAAPAWASLATALQLTFLERCGGAPARTRRAVQRELAGRPPARTTAELACREIVRALVDPAPAGSLLPARQRADGGFGWRLEDPTSDGGEGALVATALATLALKRSLAHAPVPASVDGAARAASGGGGSTS